MKYGAGMGALIFASSMASAQVAQQAVQTSFDLIRQSASIRIVLNATDQVGQNVISTDSELIWSTFVDANNNYIARLEHCEYGNTGLLSRYVGDGRYFWTYNVPRNEYSSATYWKEGTTQPNNYLTTLLQDYSRSTQNKNAFLHKLLVDVYGGTNANFRPWIVAPSSNSVLINQNSNYPDPMVPNNQFTTGANQEIALFWAQRPGLDAHRTVAFFFDIDQFGVRNLRQIEYRDNPGGQPYRYTFWRMNLTTQYQPNAASFIFLPPTNARSVASTRPGIG